MCKRCEEGGGQAKKGVCVRTSARAHYKPPVIIHLQYFLSKIKIALRVGSKKKGGEKIN